MKLSIPRFYSFDDCINCIKKKQTNKRNFETNSTLNVLELIHIDICESFPTLFGMVSNIL